LGNIICTSNTGTPLENEADRVRHKTYIDSYNDKLCAIEDPTHLLKIVKFEKNLITRIIKGWNRKER
jgi:hypothetical protein